MALLLSVPTVIVAEFRIFDIMGYLGGCVCARCWPSSITSSCDVHGIGFSILVVRRYDTLRASRRLLRAVIRSRQLNCSFDARLRRLLLLAPFATPASETIIVIASVRGADALKEFSVFHRRDMTSWR
jgi:hypothetical protein